MNTIDHCAFNGDADGLCALQQLRLAGELGPQVHLVSGVKRDIELLRRVRAGPGERVTVLDVAHEQNREATRRLLDAGVRVRYFDHHFAGELPRHPAFESFIDTAAQVCTSLLVNTWLDGRHHRWAVAAAFGDGLAGPARALAKQHGLANDEVQALEELGLLLNYNAYGDSLSDLHFEPLALAAELLPYHDPLDFIRHSTSFTTLRIGHAADMAAAAGLNPGTRAGARGCTACPSNPGREGSVACWPTSWRPVHRARRSACSAPGRTVTGRSACGYRKRPGWRRMPSAGSFQRGEGASVLPGSTVWPTRN